MGTEEGDMAPCAGQGLVLRRVCDLDNSEPAQHSPFLGDHKKEPETKAHSKWVWGWVGMKV